MSEIIGFLPAASPVEGACCSVFGNDSETCLVVQPQVAEDVLAAHPDPDNVTSSSVIQLLDLAIKPGC